MNRWLLELSFRGAGFHGWQRQPNARSVQQSVEEALSIVLRQDIAITGAGRTDTGVNARQMFAHFDTPGHPALCDSNSATLLRSLNRLCGPDIALSSIKQVPRNFHARFDAKCRTYKYFVTPEKSPFAYPLSWQCPDLDFELMNEAAEILLATRDFTSFAKLHSDAKTNICHVTEAVWTPYENPIYPTGSMVFTISADRFLRNMVRAVVGTLIEVGRHKMSTDEFRDVILAKNRCAAGTSMPPHALFLWKIDYPDISG